jgi:hypothetical protein
MDHHRMVLLSTLLFVQDRLKCFLLSCEPVWLVHALVFGFMAVVRVR